MLPIVVKAESCTPCIVGWGSTTIFHNQWKICDGCKMCPYYSLFKTRYKTTIYFSLRSQTYHQGKDTVVITDQYNRIDCHMKITQDTNTF